MFRLRKARSVDPWDEYERLSAKVVAALSPAQLRLVALGGLRTEVNNGGFHQYFFNTAGDLTPEAIGAAESVGATHLADLIRRAAALLPTTNLTDRDERQDALDEIEPEAFAALDAEYLAIEQSTDLDDLMSACFR